jgi:hypothetical protein
MRPSALLAAAVLCSALSAEASYVTPVTSPTAGGTLVYITTDKVLSCPAGNCTPIVQFDGIPSSDVTIIGSYQLNPM